MNERIALVTALAGAAAFGALAERTYRRVILPGSGLAQLVLIAGVTLQQIAHLGTFAGAAPWLERVGTAALFAGAAGILLTRDRPPRSTANSTKRSAGPSEGGDGFP